jgi:hypothetical protein
MDEIGEDIRFSKRRRRQIDRLLGRMDRALVNTGRAVWSCIIEGFAAYGSAECGLWLDPGFQPAKKREVVIQQTPNYPYHYGMIPEDELRSDFADLDELIRALQTAGE